MFQCHVGLPMVKQPCKANSWWSWSRRLQAELACRPWYAWAPFKSCPLSWGYPNSWMVYNEQFCKKVMVWGVPRLEGHKNCKVAAAGSCFFFRTGHCGSAQIAAFPVQRSNSIWRNRTKLNSTPLCCSLAECTMS